MESPNFPDPNRIPSSIFTSTKSSAPTEWSMASNESLFSIHGDNSSFSRDHVTTVNSSSNSMMEPRAAEAMNANAEAMNAEAMKEVMHANAEANTRNVQHLSGCLSPRSDASFAFPTHPEAAIDEAKAKKEKVRRGKQASGAAFHSHRSNESFAFPILTGERGGGPLKADDVHPPPPEKTEQLPQRSETPKAAPAAGANKWFSCCSCFSSCH